MGTALGDGDDVGRGAPRTGLHVNAGPVGTTPQPWPSEAWTVANHGDHMVAVSNDPQIRMALARSSVGRVVLPTFAGNAVPDLVRVSDVIDTLTPEEWLVCHQDTRHGPAIRAAIDAIVAGLRTHTPLRDTGQSPTLTVG